jgi:hypothetical protein
MTEIPLPPPALPGRSSPAHHLDLLSTFHYVVGGLNVLGGCAGLIYLIMGIVFLVATPPDMTAEEATVMGVVFTALGGLFFLASLTFAAALAYAGLCLQRRQHWHYCFTMAIITCASVMFCACGLVNLPLGIFSLVILLKPEVKDLFGVPNRRT